MIFWYACTAALVISEEQRLRLEGSVGRKGPNTGFMGRYALAEPSIKLRELVGAHVPSSLPIGTAEDSDLVTILNCPVL
jgi:hypothetical protein